MPDLCDGMDDTESNIEFGDVEEDQEITELEALLDAESTESKDPVVEIQEEAKPLRRSTRTTAGVKRYDEAYEWN